MTEAAFARIASLPNARFWVPVKTIKELLQHHSPEKNILQRCTINEWPKFECFGQKVLYLLNGSNNSPLDKCSSEEDLIFFTALSNKEIEDYSLALHDILGIRDHHGNRFCYPSKFSSSYFLLSGIKLLEEVGFDFSEDFAQNRILQIMKMTAQEFLDSRDIVRALLENL